MFIINYFYYNYIFIFRNAIKANMDGSIMYIHDDEKTCNDFKNACQSLYTRSTKKLPAIKRKIEDSNADKEDSNTLIYLNIDEDPILLDKKDGMSSIFDYRYQWCNLLRLLWADDKIHSLFAFPEIDKTFVKDLDTSDLIGKDFIISELTHFIYDKLFYSKSKVVIKEILIPNHEEEIEIEISSLSGYN